MIDKVKSQFNFFIRRPVFFAFDFFLHNFRFLIEFLDFRVFLGAVLSAEILASREKSFGFYESIVAMLGPKTVSSFELASNNIWVFELLHTFFGTKVFIRERAFECFLFNVKFDALPAWHFFAVTLVLHVFIRGRATLVKRGDCGWVPVVRVQICEKWLLLRLRWLRYYIFVNESNWFCCFLFFLISCFDATPRVQSCQETSMCCVFVKFTIKEAVRHWLHKRTFFRDFGWRSLRCASDRNFEQIRTRALPRSLPRFRQCHPLLSSNRLNHFEHFQFMAQRNTQTV